TGPHVYIYFFFAFCFVLFYGAANRNLASVHLIMNSYPTFSIGFPWPPPHGCPKNETYKECQSSTCGERRCGEPKPGGSFLDCGTGCFCNSGYFRVLNESCVLK
ncbi:secreted protein, putative, partial [Ixodes scapularis]